MNRRIYFRQLRFILISFILVLVFSCKKKLPEIKWTDTVSITNESKESSQDSIPLDIYIDATPSLDGFAVGELTVYGQFLDLLEASAVSAWKNADPKYYKFGEKIKRIGRDEFLSAKNNNKFYHEFTSSLIDSVFKRTNINRLSVVITDLFQNNGDVNSMVEKIKTHCFKNGVMVGILGIKSKFIGTVHVEDENKTQFPLVNKERPFYALFFGDPDNMGKLFEALKTKEFIEEDQILIISNHILKSANASIIKTKESKFVNKKAPRTQANNSFDFSMKEAGKEARFNFELTFDRNSRCVDFKDKTIEAVVYKKSITDTKNANPESILTNDIKFENINRQGNKITATLVLNNEDPAGNYSYLIYLQPNILSGFLLPGWINDFSTDNPIQGTPSESKTRNLENLISRLVIAKNAVTPTFISKSYINIYKR